MTSRLGPRALVRVDAVYRNFDDFYSTRVDTTTGQVTNDLGQRFDINVVENTNRVERKYKGLNFSAIVAADGPDHARRRLHAVAHLGQRRRRNVEQRPGHGRSAQLP